MNRTGSGRRKHIDDPASFHDDMRNPPRDGSPRFVVDLLDALETEPAPESLLQQFIRLDDEANLAQRRHVLSAKVGIFAGTLALCLAIFQLSFRDWIEGFQAPCSSQAPFVILTKPCASVAVFFIESTLIVGSLFFVLPQLWGPNRWLLPRYRAEQLRLSKWRLFIDPALATRDATSLASEIQSAVIENDIHEAAELRGRSRHEAPVSLPRREPSDSDRNLRRVLDYYVENRLAAQIRYFHRKSEEEKGLLASPALTPTAFVVTLVFVMIHLGAEGIVLSHRQKVPSFGTVSFAFAFFAALLPAMVAGLRTWRSAFEATRNATRACAKESALAAYRKRLQDPAIAASEAFGILACCEGLFAQEQGEWLRLMLEAESIM